MVKTDWATDGKGIVEVPICSPEGPKETTVPDNVIAKPLGETN